jgi:phosphate transport system substrate-binding protein
MEYEKDERRILMKKSFILVGMVLCLSLLGARGYAEDLRIDGSTTVLPIAQRAAEVFMQKNPGTKVFVTGSGSGTGIKALIDGTTMLATSSREAKESEIADGKKKGVNITEHKIALDGVIAVVHPSNKLDNISMAQLKSIYNGTIKTWKELGGSDRPISVVSRDTSSGTYEVWQEKVLGKDKVRPDALQVASNGQMIQTVAQNPFAIGYIGVGYVDKSIKVIKINGMDPTEKSVRDFTWPVARYLYLCSNGKPAGVAGRFIEFLLSKDGQAVVKEEKFVTLQ